MSDNVLESELDLTGLLDIVQLEKRLQGELNGRVRFFRLVVHGAGLVLQGKAVCFYAKQLAQHAVMKATDLPILANDIEVT